MTRRSDKDLHHLFDWASSLPPWLCVLLAAASWLLCQYLRELPLSPITVLAQAGQIFLPVVFLVGAIAGVMKRRKRQALATQVKASIDSSALLDMTWHEFELVVSEHFRELGYNVTETGKNGPDGGVDLVLRKDDEIFLVQCKQWRAFKVSVEIVRELYGVMAARGAAGGFVVTSGRFTDDAQKFVQGRNIVLLDGTQLLARIRGPEHQAGLQLAQPEIPNCPTCGSNMLRRTATRGATKGKEFWGCPGYPRCRGTRPI